ncbi:hypothetical protein CN204_03505 [Sinorhizobium meliloti]|nr:RES domain-containing protein [Sinorhizobium meliloti]RVH88077.1 hypothetical protein CN204_03505 [Sinorhizobium meliloti]RVM24377.1 hypothetical protein CN132_21025 [Sinorhizobium meliloti]RVO04271.1 hypothetical protein CN102_21005 [Sinorhizobium meliloti]
MAALDAGDVVVRVHQKIHGAIFFGPAPGATPQGRFDAPAGQYRLLYVAQRLEGAFVETVLRRPANRIVRRAFVEERMWTPLRLHRQLVLAKLERDAFRRNRKGDSFFCANQIHHSGR